MRVLVCGGRDYADRDRVYGALNRLREQNPGKIVIIAGKAPGADTLAEDWARIGLREGVSFRGYAANWKALGKAAGPIRNQLMIDEGKPDLVIAFPGGRGTADMVRRAKAAGIKVIEVPATPHDGGRG